MDFLKNIKKIHFTAIGGIGVSAIAKLCHSEGIKISGSDLTESEITNELKTKLDIELKIGQHPEMINDSVDIVIHSPAVPKSDPELQKAISLNIPIYSYPEILGKISKKKYTIAISGTNGKTTTTSMITEAMKDQNINPTVIVGGILQKFESNYLYGDSNYLILEACEYKRSFLNIFHDIAVITNITEDHLDYFKDLNDIQNAFKEFVDNKKNTGILICNTQLKNLQTIIQYAKEKEVKIIPYEKYLTDEYSINIPGEHNRQNMATALAIVEALDLDVKRASMYLSTKFSGTKRRMEHIGFTKYGAKLYDDYAHNPEGIQLLLNGLKSYYPHKKIVVLFEPHLYSRTEDFKEEFGKVLSNADELYLFPVYKAREKKQEEKDFILKDFIFKENNFYIVEKPEEFKEMFEKKHYDENYIIITVGAGDIWKHGLSIKH
jgi:UDP-N-acetylmuramate--alanine ligase